MKYASVRVIGIPFAVDKPYAYHIPTHLEDRVVPGSVVVVPFGGANRTHSALVESVSDHCDFPNTKPILCVPGKYIYISKELSELCTYLSGRLLCSVGDAVRCVLPAGLGVHKSYFYRIAEGSDDPAKIARINLASADVYAYIHDGGRVSERELKSYVGQGATAAANALTKLGLCVRETDFECVINTKTERVAEIIDDPTVLDEMTGGYFKLTEKQRTAYETLLGAEGTLAASELARTAHVSVSVIEELASKGLIRIRGIERDRSARALETAAEKNYRADFTLSEEQNAALEALTLLYDDDKPHAALLWGVTGSGKTNVILKLIDKVLADGKTVIMLVPEIALTAQTVGRFAARYKKNGIALLHSGLSGGERVDAWKRIVSGEARIVIGTRSAVFAPLSNIGLIVIDEEHDSSFKSDSSPRYHARDVAKFRCAYNNALLLMASATPSVESFYNAEKGRYTLVSLQNRYGNAALPSVELYDLRSEAPFVLPDDAFDPFEKKDAAEASETDVFFETGGFTVEPHGEKDAADSAIPLMLGEKLKDAIRDRLQKKEQTILFINRRGYRALAVCRSCGYTFECPQCSVALTHHRYKRVGADRMVCHYCGYTTELPQICPRCEKKRVSFIGSGTQLLEETLLKEFPEARILRMDADTTHTKGAHDEILGAFRAGEADILLGTQMVAKGHDFPNVTLVGVILADTSLLVNDFRANEKTFSLLTQILGRAGRADKPGHAVLQTYVPDNEVLRLAAAQDYKTFYTREIAFRRSSVFPPVCDIVTVNFSADVEADVSNAVMLFGRALDEAAKKDYADVKFILYGPFRHEIYRLAGKYRMRYLFKCRDSARFRELLGNLLRAFIPAVKNVTVTTDVNPMNL